jgi:hypothetical protein
MDVNDTSNDNQPPVSSQIDNVKLKVDDEIGPYDVICGRNGAAFNNTGNRRFRVTIEINIQQYVAATSRNEKSNVISSVLKMMRGCGGRFLKKRGSHSWIDIGDQRAREKVGHALRDRAVKTISRDNGTESSSDESSTSVLEKEYEKRQSTVHEETCSPGPHPSIQQLEEEKLPSPVEREEVTSAPKHEEQHSIMTGETRIGADEADNILDILGSPPKKKKKGRGGAHGSNTSSEMNEIISFADHEYSADYEDFWQEGDRSAESLLSTTSWVAEVA